MRYIIPISGKDSLATAIVQRKLEPELPYEFAFCDVRMELPETYAWIDKVEETLGIQVNRIGRSLEDEIMTQERLPSHQARFCTPTCKINPMHEFIGDDEAVMYMGIRADEDRRVTGIQSADHITHDYPLIKAGLDLNGVYATIEPLGILPPSFFWDRLHQMVLHVCNKKQRQVIDALKPWELNRVFAWRSRSNCFMCFYQSQYEWVGLLEHHPDLFLRAEKLEQQCGSREIRSTLKNYTFNMNYPLSYIRSDAPNILKKRAIKILEELGKVVSKLDAKGRFSLNQISGDMPDLMSTTSCGLYCGK